MFFKCLFSLERLELYNFLSFHKIQISDFANYLRLAKHTHIIYKTHVSSQIACGKCGGESHKRARRSVRVI